MATKGIRRVRALPVQKIRRGSLRPQETVDLGEEPIEEQFKDSNIGIGKSWNAVRNTVIRGYHRDDGTDAHRIKHPKMRKQSKVVHNVRRYDQEFVLKETVRNQNDRGYKRLDEFQEEKKRKLVWHPATDFDDRGDPGKDQGMSTEQGDAPVDVVRDGIQRVTLVEPYASARKFAGVKLRKIK